jgi:DNA-binding transcriptional MerR regulator/methylmalonyl-CoA mutase cobalamin-binding subunit
MQTWTTMPHLVASDGHTTTNPDAFMITIGAAARQTGIPTATLRKWETRYGFPVPVRTAGDQRAFQPSDLDALIEISRRMAAGQRAGLAIHAVKLGLQQAMPGTIESATMDTPEVAHALALLLHNDLESFEGYLVNHLARHGAAVFASELAIPLIEAVGSLWQQGSLPVYAEHLFSSILQKVTLQSTVRQTQTKISVPRVLLATPAGESHTLVLTLLNAVLHEAGIPTVFLPGGLPAAEIAAAALVFNVQVVALSASVACTPRLLVTELRSLRTLLDAGVELWIGGDGAHKISTRMDGVTVMTSIDAAVHALKNKIGQDPNIVGPEKDKKSHD